MRPSSENVTRPIAFGPYGEGSAAPAASRAVARASFQVPTIEGIR
jgi:hypothetical protein